MNISLGKKESNTLFRHVHYANIKILSGLLICLLYASGLATDLKNPLLPATHSITDLDLKRNKVSYNNVITGVITIKGQFFCETKESANRAIPTRHYTAIIYKSPKLGYNVILLDVPGRSGIEIHNGHRSTGCILISRPDFDRLMSLVTSPLYVNIS
jgi:Family of unknown function (DUF5675)